MEGVLTFALADVKANIEVGLEKDDQPCFLPALKHHAGYREQKKNAGGPGTPVIQSPGALDREKYNLAFQEPWF